MRALWLGFACFDDLPPLQRRALAPLGCPLTQSPRRGLDAAAPFARTPLFAFGGWTAACFGGVFVRTSRLCCPMAMP